jgi:hypothetical protein
LSASSAFASLRSGVSKPSDQVFAGEFQQHLGVDIILTERLLVLFEPQTAQPENEVKRLALSPPFARWRSFSTAHSRRGFTGGRRCVMIKSRERPTRCWREQDRRAPENFRRAAPRKETVITSRLPRYSGMVESMKENFLFIRSGCYPRHIFAHYSSIDPDVLESLSIGQEANFGMRFNRQGPLPQILSPRQAEFTPASRFAGFSRCGSVLGHYRPPCRAMRS